MYRVTKREKVMIGAGIFAVVFMCSYMFVYQPKKKEVLRLQEEIRIVDLETEGIVRAIPRLRKLEQELTPEQTRVSLAKKTTTGEQQILELVRQLAGGVYKLDMDVISLQLREEALDENSGYKSLTMVLNIECPYRHLGSYLEGLSDLPALFTVDRIEIVRDEKIFPKLEVSFTLSTFVL